MKVTIAQILSLSSLALIVSSTTASSTGPSEKPLERKSIPFVPQVADDLTKREPVPVPVPAGSPYGIELGSLAAISNFVARDMLSVGAAPVPAIGSSSLLRRAEDNGEDDGGEECEEDDEGDDAEECTEPMGGDDSDTCDEDASEGCEEDNDEDDGGVNTGVGLAVVGDGSETPSNIAEGSLAAEDGCTKYTTTVKGDTCYKLIGTKDADTLKKFYANNPSVDTGCQNLEIGLAYCVASS